MKNATGLRLIAGFKLVQGVLLCLVGTGLLILITKDPDAEVARWLAALQIDTNNELVRNLSTRLDAISPLKFERLGIAAFIYAGMLLFEGTGLLLQKRWAEFLTIFVTGSFLPLELLEVARHFTLAPVILLLANGAVVWYLVHALKLKHRQNAANEDPKRN